MAAWAIDGCEYALMEMDHRLGKACAEGELEGRRGRGRGKEIAIFPPGVLKGGTYKCKER